MFSNIIKIADIAGLNYCQYLSKKEQELYESRSNFKRQQKFMAGRMLAKYLLLNQIMSEGSIAKMPQFEQELKPCLESSQAKNNIINFGKPMNNQQRICESEFTLKEVSPCDLAVFPPCLYAKLEILPKSKAEKGSYLNAIWCNDRLTTKLSIAHHKNISLVSISKKNYLGLDIECFEKRIDAFYENSFTEKEKDWIFQKMQLGNLSKNWWFTFFWTLKEAGLKLLTNYNMNLTLWNMPALEIAIEDTANWLKFQPNRKILQYFQCNVSLNIYAKSIPVKAFVAFNKNQIITKLKATTQPFKITQ